MSHALIIVGFIAGVAFSWALDYVLLRAKPKKPGGDR